MSLGKHIAKGGPNKELVCRWWVHSDSDDDLCLGMEIYLKKNDLASNKKPFKDQ